MILHRLLMRKYQQPMTPKRALSWVLLYGFVAFSIWFIAATLGYAAEVSLPSCIESKGQPPCAFTVTNAIGSAIPAYGYADHDTTLPGRQICRYDDDRKTTECHVAAEGEKDLCEPVGASLPHADPKALAHFTQVCMPIVNALKNTDQAARRLALITCLAGHNVRGQP